MNFTNHFLIAMPNMGESYFERALILVCEHSEQGALGLMINRPIELTLQVLLERMEIEAQDSNLSKIPVYFGGPIQVDHGFVLHQPVAKWEATLFISGDHGEIGLSSSKDILQAIGQGKGPEKILVGLGYAGWAPGQLEHEVSENFWLTIPAHPEILFEIPAEERFMAALEILGVNFSNLSEQVGHA